MRTKFQRPVRAAMTSKLDTVGAKAPLSTTCCRSSTATTWRSCMDGDEFLGLITRIDLLNHLRRRMK